MLQKFNIEGPLLVEPKVFNDERGFFTERYQQDRFYSLGIKDQFIQDNFSRSQSRVLRGMHLQHTPAQIKMITCLRGCIQDIIIDLRKESSTFGEHISIDLFGDAPKWFYIPSGFAHGFCVLSDEGADVLYKVNQHYNPLGEVGIAWDDADLNLPWKIQNPILSMKDQKNITLKEYLKLNVS